MSPLIMSAGTRCPIPWNAVLHEPLLAYSGYNKSTTVAAASPDAVGLQSMPVRQGDK